MSIWNYSKIKKELEAKRYLSLNEGDTPVQSFEDETNVVHVKRDDLNPTGSWKDRGTAWKLTELIQSGTKEAVISSTGNAAISFLYYINELELGFRMHIVISPSGSELKREMINELAERGDHKVYLEEKAKRFSSKLSAELGVSLLRASTDSSILKGYWSLGFEVGELIRKQTDGGLSADRQGVWLFCPVSSGTGLVGMLQGLQIKLGENETMPRIVVCQTEKCHPIVDMVKNSNLQTHPESTDQARFSKVYLPIGRRGETSLADAISNRSVLRSPQILKIIEETNGDALMISDEDLRKAEEYINITQAQDDTSPSNQVNNKNLSYNSLLSVAGYLKMKEEIQDANVICIASGR